MRALLPPLAALVLVSCVRQPPVPCTSCGDVCVDLQTDSSHCGACDTACPGGTRCELGSCVATCGVGLERCAGSCVAIATDPANCGGCGRACGASERCAGGSCRPTPCPAGTASCGAQCVTLANDPSNCGACGRGCDGGFCSAGACVGACPPGASTCGGQCTVVTSDPANCGACGRSCDGGYCAAGACMPSCPLDACGLSCVDTRVDPAHCGACGRICAAPAHLTAACLAGVCTFGTCERGWADCNRDLSDGCECQYQLVSVALDGGPANGESSNASVDDTGTLVVFTSTASNLVADDTNAQPDVFLRDLRSKLTIRLSVSADGGELTQGAVAGFVSANGRAASFVTSGPAIVPDLNGATRDVIVVDLVTGRRTYGFLGVDGGQPRGPDALYGVTQLSSDGQLVLHSSAASGVLPNDTVQPTSEADVFVFDRGSQELRAASVARDGGFVTASAPGGPANASSLFMSGNGRWVGLQTSMFPLEPLTDTCVHTYVADLSGPSLLTTRVGLDDGGVLPCDTDRRASTGGLSNDRGDALFFSSRTNPATGATGNDFLLYRRPGVAGQSTPILKTRNGLAPNGASHPLFLDSAGNRLVFFSFAANLGPSDMNGNRGDCFVWHSDGGVDHLNQPYFAVPPDAGAAACTSARLSRQGDWAVFDTDYAMLQTDQNGLRDVYLRLTP